MFWCGRVDCAVEERTLLRAVFTYFIVALHGGENRESKPFTTNFHPSGHVEVLVTVLRVAAVT